MGCIDSIPCCHQGFFLNFQRTFRGHLIDSALLSFVIFLFHFVAIQTNGSFLLYLQVEPKTTMCFYEHLKEDTPFEMDFEVLRGGLLDIKLTMANPAREIVDERVAFFNRPEEALNDIEGRYKYIPKMNGEFQFCFDNTMSRWTSKVIAFQVRSQRANKSVAAKLQDLGPMVDSIIKMGDDLDAIEKTQLSSRAREKNNFRVLNKISSRLQWLVFFSTAVLVGVSVFSLLHIQKWFNEQSQSSGV